MKTLYKNSRLIAAAIVATLLFSTGTAVAVTKSLKQSADSEKCETQPVVMTQADDLGRFVVTPKAARYIRPAADMGRFVVSQHGAVYVPANELAEA